jgi:hypothetical protein
MTFTQHIEDCADEACPHGAPCARIRCTADADIPDPDTGGVAHPAGTVVWSSHWHADVHPEHRINPAHPALDHRGQGAPVPVTAAAACADCAPKMP